MTLKEHFEIALAKRGERLVKLNFKHDVWTRAKGGFYYLGRSGALRFGRNSTTSRPVSDEFKRILMFEATGK